MHHLEINSVVIGVTLYTGGTGSCGTRKGGMQSLVLLQLNGNLPMALEASKRGCTGGDLMTLDAVRISVEALMCSGQRTRRNLRIGDGHQAKTKADNYGVTKRTD